jgi:hypothetical protein
LPAGQFSAVLHIARLLSIWYRNWLYSVERVQAGENG